MHPLRTGLPKTRPNIVKLCLFNAQRSTNACKHAAARALGGCKGFAPAVGGCKVKGWSPRKCVVENDENKISWLPPLLVNPTHLKEMDGFCIAFND